MSVDTSKNASVYNEATDRLRKSQHISFMLLFLGNFFIYLLSNT